MPLNKKTFVVFFPLPFFSFSIDLTSVTATGTTPAPVQALTIPWVWSPYHVASAGASSTLKTVAGSSMAEIFGRGDSRMAMHAALWFLNKNQELMHFGVVFGGCGVCCFAFKIS